MPAPLVPAYSLKLPVSKSAVKRKPFGGEVGVGVGVGEVWVSGLV